MIRGVAAFRWIFWFLSVESVQTGARGWLWANHNRELLEAARLGSIADLRDALSAGANLKALDGDGLTALHLAAKYGHTLCIDELLTRGAHVNAVASPSGLTPLYLASGHGSTSAVRSLIQAGADVNAITASSSTALHRAVVGQGHEAVAKLLLEAGASVDVAEGARRLTALHRASFHGASRIVIELLKHGADVTLRDTNGWTCLHHAVAGGQARVTSQLVYGSSAIVNSATRDGVTPLLIAAGLGHTGIMNVLLAAGALIHSKTEHGETVSALDWARTREQAAAAADLRRALRNDPKQRQQTSSNTMTSDGETSADSDADDGESDDSKTTKLDEAIRTEL